MMGVGPITFWLATRRSTAELHPLDAMILTRAVAHVKDHHSVLCNPHRSNHRDLDLA